MMMSARRFGSDGSGGGGRAGGGGHRDTGLDGDMLRGGYLIIFGS